MKRCKTLQNLAKLCKKLQKGAKLIQNVAKRLKKLQKIALKTGDRPVYAKATTGRLKRIVFGDKVLFLVPRKDAWVSRFGAA